MGHGDCIYFCCGACAGLFSCEDVLLVHKTDCHGDPALASAQMFACERSLYLHLQQSSISTSSLVERHQANEQPPSDCVQNAQTLLLENYQKPPVLSLDCRTATPPAAENHSYIEIDRNLENTVKCEKSEPVGYFIKCTDKSQDFSKSSGIVNINELEGEVTTELETEIFSDVSDEEPGISKQMTSGINSDTSIKPILIEPECTPLAEKSIENILKSESQKITHTESCSLERETCTESCENSTPYLDEAKQVHETQSDISQQLCEVELKDVKKSVKRKRSGNAAFGCRSSRRNVISKKPCYSQVDAKPQKTKHDSNEKISDALEKQTIDKSLSESRNIENLSDKDNQKTQSPDTVQPLNKETEESQNLETNTDKVSNESGSKKANKELKKISKAQQTSNHHLSLTDKYHQYYLPIENIQSDKQMKWYHCPTCPKKCKHVGFFHRHMLTAHPDIGNQWKCSECDYTCERKGQLKLHANKHLKPFLCEMCPSRFGQHKDLKVHKLLHSGEYPYSCQDCDYQCRQAKALKEHMRKHTGEVLTCPEPECGFATYYSWVLENHRQNKHETVKRFQCPHCPYMTSDTGSYKKHEKLHAGLKDYKCSECDYRAVAKHDIVKHMRCHTKEKVFFCDRCNYSTSYSSGLRSHMMSHLGVKPWQCSICGYNSVSKAKVTRHIKQRHGDSQDVTIINLGFKLKLNISEFKQNEAYHEENIMYEVHQEEDGVIEGEPTDIVVGNMTPEDQNSDVVTQIIIHKLDDQSEVQVEEEAEHLQVVDGQVQQVQVQDAEGVHLLTLPDGHEHLQTVQISEELSEMVPLMIRVMQAESVSSNVQDIPEENQNASSS